MVFNRGRTVFHISNREALIPRRRELDATRAGAGGGANDAKVVLASLLEADSGV